MNEAREQGVIWLQDSTLADKAHEWAGRLGLRIVDQPSAQHSVYLILNSSGLSLWDQRLSHMKPLQFDLLEGPVLQRISSFGRSHPMARAVEGKERKPLRILDTTLGQGFDSLCFLKLGHEVMGLERSPYIYALLCDAIARVQKDPAELSPEREKFLKMCNFNHLTIHLADGLTFLDTLSDPARPDVIFIDPMFPEKKKSLPRKEMQLFRQIAGEDLDAPILVQKALNRAKSRVVVKRPPDGEPLAPGVTHSFESKLVRFDMYLV